MYYQDLDLIFSQYRPDCRLIISIYYMALQYPGFWLVSVRSVKKRIRTVVRIFPYPDRYPGCRLMHRIWDVFTLVYVHFLEEKYPRITFKNKESKKSWIVLAARQNPSIKTGRKQAIWTLTITCKFWRENFWVDLKQNKHKLDVFEYNILNKWYVLGHKHCFSFMYFIEKHFRRMPKLVSVPVNRRIFIRWKIKKKPSHTAFNLYK